MPVLSVPDDDPVGVVVGVPGLRRGYAGTMIARALVALGGAALTRPERAAGGVEALERATCTGEGADWETAQAAANVPADALILHWTRE